MAKKKKVADESLNDTNLETSSVDESSAIEEEVVPVVRNYGE